MNNIRISYCTAIRNRLHHLKQTLPVNLRERPGAGVQFVLMDYNSSDGLEEYISSTYKREISAGRIVYYRETSAGHFDRCHARNMAFKLGEGDILSNLDADNFLGDGYSDYVQSVFDSSSQVFVSAMHNAFGIGNAMGKIAMRKEDFAITGGYDEQFNGYGFEDEDLHNRCGILGLLPVIIQNPRFLSYIAHEDSERVSNEAPFLNLHSFFIKHLTPDASEFLALQNDGTCLSVIIENAYTSRFNYFREPQPMEFASSYHFVSAESGWQQGTWRKDARDILVNFPKAIFQVPCKNQHYGKTGQWQKITDPEKLREAMFFFMQLRNRDRMEENLRNRTLNPNQTPGTGRVYRNFNYSQAIDL